MTTYRRGKLPARSFGGYEWEPAAGPNPELTRVSRGTSIGEYLRRYWQPVAMTKSLGALPYPVTILGEDLVLFRDGRGEIGLLGRHCSHRNASLEFGKIEPRGLRCCYHGWLYDTDGAILETPGDRPERCVGQNAFHPAYPVQEYKGFVFAYMGPPDEMPAFPIYDYMDIPGEDLEPFMWFNPCNWLQVRENTVDPIHINFLHSMFQTTQFGKWAYELPEIAWRETPIGQIVTSTRRVGSKVFVRTNELILPNLARVPDIDDVESAELSEKGRGLSTWVVPIDDTSAWHLGWYHFDDRMDDAQRDRMREIMSWGQSGDRPYQERRGNPGDWDAWVSQGVVSVQGNEHPTRMDGAVMMYRKQLQNAVAALKAGRPLKNSNRSRDRSDRIPTYAGNSIRELPVMEDAKEDRRQWRSYADEVVAKALAATPS